MKHEIQRAFDRAASHYDLAAKVQYDIGTTLLSRLDYIKITPNTILDLGCGSGKLTQLIKQRYPKACIIGVDFAFNMLVESKKKHRLFKKWPLCQADMNKLPFADTAFDLVIANQSIHWSPNIPQVLAEIHRIMAPNACLMFSTLGFDTFTELKSAWQAADHHAHTNAFHDLHDIGDHLLATHFSDPVVDVEHLTIHYPSLHNLLQSLKAQGVRNINPQRHTGLTGKQAFVTFQNAYEALKTQTGKYPLTYEVVYGHAWRNAMTQRQDGTETFISIDVLKQNRQQRP